MTVQQTTAPPIESNARWQAVVCRDATCDGKFYYSVVTTGVYCNPSCAARLPRPEHVAFHLSPKDAEAAGYRPCKRCKPDAAPLGIRRAAQVEQLCRLIESSEEQLSLEVLAASIGASTSHTHRLFKTVTGVTPKQYAAERRRQRVRDALRDASTVTEAIYDSGYGSAARFYDSATDVLGMRPRAYRTGGQGELVRFAIAQSSLGSVLVAATDRGICAILLGDDPQILSNDLAQRFPDARLMGAEADFDDLVARVVGLVDRPSLSVDLPLDIRGTAFQQRVWTALMQIPAGQTTSYSELAAEIGAPSAARAVAGACAANRLAVAVPCHRVLRQSGELSGYRWGVERKRQLLEREGQG